MPLRYQILDVFTDRAFGGNPLAVFPDGEGVDDALMQRIARELNLSETVFVLPPDDPRHHARLRIFTPAAELPFAGHPTVGTACALLALGRFGPGDAADVVLEEGVGPVAARVVREDGRTRATFTTAMLPEEGPPAPPADDLAHMLGLQAADLLDAPSPGAYSCGVPFLFVPVRDRSALARARLSVPVWEEVLGGHAAREVFVVTEDARSPEATHRARMFAPRLGIPEDPATGSAAAAFAGWAASALAPGEGTLRWRIVQGVEMGRPSLMEVEADRTAAGLVAVRVGGESVRIGEGRLDL